MASIFSKIVAGEIPAYKIAESEDYLSFLDINPLSKGHALVVPKKEVDNVFDLDDELYSGLFGFAKKVAKAIQDTVSCKRIGMVVYGLDVPHAHLHLIPLQGIGNEIDFSKPKVQLTKEEFLKISENINAQFLRME
ncbi:MAG: HIT domain-containing protein [Bacteroidales bacterium]|nr:HIT domain-containing protein [Bacteroidales bacterium]